MLDVVFEVSTPALFLFNWYSGGISYVVPRLWIGTSDKTWKVKVLLWFHQKN